MQQKRAKEAIKVNRGPIDEWIKLHSPNGLAKLALAANMSISLIDKVRCGTKIPKASYRNRLSETVGAEVFRSLERSENEAS